MKILIFFILFSFSNSYSFTLNNNQNLAFSQNEVKVNIAKNFCSNIGISDNELLAIVSEAVDQFWNKSPTSRLKLRSGSLLSVNSSFKTGLICTSNTGGCVPNSLLSVSEDILISCNTNLSNFSNSSSVLAVTVPNNIDGNTIKGSLIILNDNSTNNNISTKSRDELITLIAHELGHAIGLGHSPVKYALMYYELNSKQKSLSQDDIDGISYLYPKQQPINCGTVQDKKNPHKENFILNFLMGILLIFIFFNSKRKIFRV